MKATRFHILLLCAALIIVCYAPTLRGMFNQWWTDEDMGHGFVVPAVILWIVWRERSSWQALPMRWSAWGFVVLVAGATLHLMGALGAGLFASAVAFLITIAGTVLCFGGIPLLRAWAFPFLVSFFMLPKLAVVYNQVTLPLQLLASRIAAGMLSIASIQVIREGNILDVAGHRISVAEACSGIRYLLSLGFVAIVFAYLADAKPWMRIALLTASVPVAILANALRVAAAGLLPVLDAGTPHAMAGLFVFVLCLAMLVLTRRLLNAAYRHYHA
jgi:exosortase